MFSAPEQVLPPAATDSRRPTTTPFRAPEFAGDDTPDAPEALDIATVISDTREQLREPFAASGEPV